MGLNTGKKRKKKPKNLTYYKGKAWDACSKYVRLLYANNGCCQCYTCGAIKPIKKMQAGHGFSGRGNSILFELDIIRPQCFGCNICNSGKLDIFAYKLRRELGDKRFEELWQQRFIPRKYKIFELVALKEYFKDKFKKL